MRAYAKALDFATLDGSPLAVSEHLTPHGRLIEQARVAAGMTKRGAAKAAGISEGRWRQIVSGIQRAGGVDLPVTTKPETLTSMANAVGADPRRVLEAAGFAEASGRVDVHAIVIGHADIAPTALESASDAELLAEIARRLGRGRTSDRPNDVADFDLEPRGLTRPMPRAARRPGIRKCSDAIASAGDVELP